MGTLRERMQKELVLKGLSPRTRKIYVGEVEKFIRHHAKSPESLGSVEIKEYLHYLITSKGVASSAVNQAYSALKFFITIRSEGHGSSQAFPERAGRRYCRSFSNAMRSTQSSRQHVM